MEEVMAALRKIQNDLDEQKTTITKNADEITEKVTRNINKLLDQKLKTLEKNQEKLDKKIENQEQRLNQLERQDNINNRRLQPLRPAVFHIFAFYLRSCEDSENQKSASRAPVAAQCKEHISRNGYNYDTFYRVDPGSRKLEPGLDFEMHLAILAGSNGHILLSSKMKPSIYDPVYEFVIGGGGNKFSELRRNKGRNAKVSVQTVGILSPVDYKAFYIKVSEDGLVELGLEGEPLPVISYNDYNSIPINYFSFASWSGSQAKFLYDCPIAGVNSTTTTPDSQMVDRPVSPSVKLKMSLLSNRSSNLAPSSLVKVKLDLKVTRINYDAFESKLDTGIGVVMFSVITKGLRQLLLDTHSCQPFAPMALLVLSDLVFLRSYIRNVVTHPSIDGKSVFRRSNRITHSMKISTVYLLRFTGYSSLTHKQTDRERDGGSLSWRDDNMVWDPVKNNFTKSLKFKPGEIWKPVFHIQNSDKISFLDSDSSDLIYFQFSGEASYVLQTKVTTWCDDLTATLSNWPRDKYQCTIALAPWALHERIDVKLMKKNELDATNVMQNNDESDIDYLRNDTVLITIDIQRKPGAYDLVFYTPLLVSESSSDPLPRLPSINPFILFREVRHALVTPMMLLVSMFGGGHRLSDGCDHSISAHFVLDHVARAVQGLVLRRNVRHNMHGTFVCGFFGAEPQTTVGRNFVRLNFRVASIKIHSHRFLTTPQKNFKKIHEVSLEHTAGTKFLSLYGSIFFFRLCSHRACNFLTASEVKRRRREVSMQTSGSTIYLQQRPLKSALSSCSATVRANAGLWPEPVTSAITPVPADVF
ncbi:hypothetical protein EVAR_34443_1 [Eumeta japonica]|uniref:Farnesoic acid O-methyl transferase domain-containing protein n=1 Tax=Eumeta variegata TaxID=151549 RepID=A0A4C1WN58_EUMVA|nr:hypothetical protein EVAR_34443_1 [Eumeta japonica]